MTVQSDNRKRMMQDIINRKANRTAQLFNSELGQEVLGYLKEELDKGQLVAQTPELTYFNLGRRDAVVYINELIVQNETLERANEKSKQTTSDS